jgi:hypothetical protein
MIAKPLKGGVIAYYWNLPTWATEQGCKLHRADLGNDYGAAKSKAAAYNDLFRAWRTANKDPGPDEQEKVARVGTIDWVIAEFQTSDEYLEDIDATTRTNYDSGLELIAEHRRKSGMRFGDTPIGEILPYHVDKLFKKLRDGGKGGRVTTATHAIRAMRRAWNVAHHYNAIVVPEANPFRKVKGTGSTGRETEYGTLEQLETFVAKANELGHPSVALAALITYHWYQREIDILRRMVWSDYDPGGRVKVRHYKNRNRRKGEKENVIWLALKDPQSGSSLFPEVEAQIAITPVRGTLMVMRDKPDSRRKKPVPHQPYTVDYFGKLCREILDATNLPKTVTFASFRHGGFTETGDAGATDSEMLSGGGHKTRGVLSIYTKRTNPQAINLAKKRLELRMAKRTKAGEMSE